MRAVCLHRSPFGRFCEKSNGHTGNHRCRTFSRDDAQRAYFRQLHVGDPRWRWTETGWQTTDPDLVDEATRRLLKSKGVPPQVISRMDREKRAVIADEIISEGARS